MNIGLDAGLTAGLNIGLNAGLNAGLGAGLSAGLGTGLNAGLGAGLSAGLNTGLNAGLGAGLDSGLSPGAISGLTIGLGHFVTVSAVLFALGLYCLITRRNAVAILMGIELILNAALLNLVAFSRYLSGTPDGQVFALFGIVLAAAEAVVALAIVLQLYRAFRSVDTAETTELRG